MITDNFQKISNFFDQQ
ncbi:hypothetical protein DBR06_SOUSAS8910039 [Sousa chinensis]|uniref:Uncharacterized protein n=1 Tax=Sousa chinensis TaxID=103600 RepID=A0A484GJC3_SOUCH|nr:hypothetical protein DBR06_SOUSAS8910039 [Sousa chinensis]